MKDGMAPEMYQLKTLSYNNNIFKTQFVLTTKPKQHFTTFSYTLLY